MVMPSLIKAEPSPGPLLLERCPHLNLISNTSKGRAIFAAASIPSGTVLDVCPVLILTHEENTKHIEHTELFHYTYNWPTKGGTQQAVVFGLGSLFNHSRENQNVGWVRDLERDAIVYRTLRDVREGEELCISYGERLWFVDADGDALGEVKGNEEREEEVEVLSKIEI